MKEQSKAPSSITYKQLLMMFLTCLLTLILVDRVAESLYQLIWFPSSYDEARNTFFLRGWRRYTAPEDLPETDDTYLVILISNSQGFLVENADERLTYSQQLELILNQKMKQPVEVLNWSAPASNAAEQIILAARAISHQPNLILWVTHNTNLVRAQFRPLDFYSTDVTRLAYHPTVRQYLSDTFLSEHEANDPLDMLDTQTGLGKLAHVFEQDRYWVWWWIPQRGAFGTHLRDWDDKAIYYVNEFYETVNRSEIDIPIAFVSMPLNAEHYSDEEWAEMIAFPERVRDIYTGRDNIRVFNAIEVIPQKLFFTSTHMRPDGHRMFAEWLAEHVFADKS